MPVRYWLLIFVLGIGWGSSFFFNEILLRELGPMGVSMGRVGFGAAGCWIWLLLRRKPLGVPLASLWILGIFGLFQYAIPLTVFPITQQFITSSAAGIVNATTPIMVVIVSHFWPGGEQANLRKSIGVGFGFLGILIVASPSFQGQGESNPWALLATLAAPLCYGIALNLVRRMDEMNRTLMTAWSLTLGTILVAPIALWVEGVPQISQHETWAALLIIGFVLTAGAFILLFWLIPRVGGTTASTITYITPISAILLGVLFLQEQLFIEQLIGAATILFGLVIVDGRLVHKVFGTQPNG